MTAPLFALFLATFGIATTELAIVGVLPEIGADLGVGIPRAGLLVSGYAAGVALGSPILTILTMRLERKATLLLLMGLFVAGHVLSAVAPSYAWLLGARILAAVCHASFLGIAAVVAAASVPPDRSARAVSLVWLGFAAASLVGIPGATAIGHALGWRATFWAITLVGAVAALAIALCIPRQDAGERSHLASEVRALARTQVVLAMAISLLVCAATFSVFTYIAPFVLTTTGLRADALPAMLLCFGVGGTLGLLFAGRIRDRDALPAVIAMLLAHALVFILLMLASRSPILVAAAIAAWGFLFLAPCVPLQTRVVKEAREGPNLASTLNQSAFNVGNALGPAIGAGALWAGQPYAQLPLIGAGIAVLGAALGLLALRLGRASVAGSEVA